MVEREHGVGGQEVRRVKLSSVGCRWRSACSVQRSGGPWGEMLSGCRGFLAHDEHRKLGLFSFLKELTAVSLPGENPRYLLSSSFWFLLRSSTLFHRVVSVLGRCWPG